jgi:hypothetical protein
MESLSGNESQRKITVVLPAGLLERLNARVPARQRSRFILTAIEEHLATEELLAALDETAGAWSDENHPEMRGPAEIDRWLADLRNAWRSGETSA